MTDPETPPDSSPSEQEATKSPGEGFRQVDDEDSMAWEQPLPPNVKSSLTATVALLVFLSLSGLGVLVYLAWPRNENATKASAKPAPVELGTRKEFFKEPKYMAAVENFEQGKYKGSLDLAESMERRYPHIGELFYMQAMCRYYLRDREGAEEEVVAAIKLNGNHERALSLYSLILFEKEQYEEAVAAASKALQINNAIPDCWYVLGASCRKLDRLDLAEKALVKMAESAPTHAPAAWELAQLYEESDRAEKGLEVLEGLVEAAERNSTGWQYLSRYLWRHGQPERAEEAALKALEIQPNSASHHAWISEIYEKDGTWEKAVKHAESAVRLSGEAPENILLLGYCYSKVGKLADSNLLLRQVLKAEPENYDALTFLGKNLSDLRRFSEAQGYLERAAKTQPEVVDAWDLLQPVYEALGQKGKLKEARATAEKILEARAEVEA